MQSLSQNCIGFCYCGINQIMDIFENEGVITIPPDRVFESCMCWHTVEQVAMNRQSSLDESVLWLSKERNSCFNHRCKKKEKRIRHTVFKVDCSILRSIALGGKAWVNERTNEPLP